MAVADGLGTLLAVHRPVVVVIGGSAATYLPLFRDAAEEVLDRLGPWISHPEIRSMALDDYGGATGGALLALRHLAEQEQETHPSTRVRCVIGE